jgi:hypothetical protein
MPAFALYLSTSSVSMMILKLEVPASTACPKIIFSEMPFK